MRVESKNHWMHVHAAGDVTLKIFHYILAKPVFIMLSFIYKQLLTMSIII